LLGLCGCFIWWLQGRLSFVAVQITPPAEGQVVVVGDTHGQFHDVCRM
jgi:hypothetical protein